MSKNEQDLYSYDTEESDHLNRPEWLKFYYTSWAESTALMNDEQRGWYIRLLMYAASNGEPPGYLPADELELKNIAGYKDLSTDVEQLLEQLSIPVDILTNLRTDRERRWRKVLSKFRSSTTYEGMVYNKKLLNTLKDAYRKLKFKVKAGKASAAKRRQKKELSTVVPTQPQQTANRQSTPVEQEGTVEGTGVGTTVGTDKEQVLTYARALPDSILNTSMEVKGNEGIKTTDSNRARKRKTTETLFDEDRFSITDKMRANLSRKFPEFDDGDYEYLTEKFKLIRHGTWYTSWSRSFYNFVNNQVVNYGYRPGSYNWRREQDAKQQIPQQQPRYESAADRNERLEREQDELTRRLQGSGDVGGEEDPEALPLTADDY